MFLAFFERFVAILAILYDRITIWHDYNVGLFEERTNKKKFIYSKKFLITQLSNNDQILLNKLLLGVLKFSRKKIEIALFWMAMLLLFDNLMQ